MPKYIDKYPSKTKPGKWVYKYENTSGSLYDRVRSNNKKNNNLMNSNSKGMRKVRSRQYINGIAKRGRAIANTAREYYKQGSQIAKRYANTAISYIKEKGSSAIQKGKSILNSLFSGFMNMRSRSMIHM